MPRRPTSEHLARLLALPAWVAEHPGTSIERAAAHFGVTPGQIEADVNTLWVSGLPGGLPGELVDFDAADFEAGRLSLSEPLGLDRPVRLSRQEALSLVMALRVLRSVLAGDEDSLRALGGAEAALTGLLSHGPDEPLDPCAAPAAGRSHTLEDTGEQEQVRTGSRHLAEILASVRQALRERRRLEITYVSATDTASQRQVDPMELRSDGAHLWLLGWCLSAGAQRTFRLDRVLAATVLPTRARARRAPKHRRGQGLASPAAGPTAALTLRPSGRWLVEQVPCLSVEERDDGCLRATIQGRDEDWLVSLALSAGSHLIAVEPAALAQRVGGAARRALAAYGPDAGGRAGPAPHAGGV
ncbi:helix-turn-helix transcriptional regulator [Actinomyces capricornis]|uniref:WYL domain-containing protein n=1 Tax=Actinomyces capricornis TaxID=2755559 RepID=A0ABN6K7S5_9ACTO|nr:WYL domain-containing protein [Actinomyces capricornis]BDA65714.1 WYL domain-containing protein [Actinomyces capricornis]